MKKTGLTPLSVIFLVIFIDLLGFGLIIPIIPFYLEQFLEKGDNVGQVMAMMITVYSLMQFIFAPIWGRVSDRIGRRPIILMSLLGTMLTHIWFALSTELWMLFASRILTGIFAATVPTASAYISDVTDHSNRAKGMGMVGAAFGLGFILGPAAGGILTEFGGFRVPLFSAAILSFSAFIVAWFTLKESLKPGEHKHSDFSRYRLVTLFKALKNPRLGLLFTIFFLVSLSFANMETIFALFAERKFGFDARQAGYVFGFIGVCSALIQGVFIGKLSARFGEKRLIMAATLLLATAFFIMPVFDNVWLFVGAAGLMAVSLGMHNPSVMSLVSKNADDAGTGGVLGLNQSFSAMGRVLGPLWAGFFFDHVGIGFPLTSAGFLLLLAFALSFKLRRNSKLVE
ncbi:MAG: MFS transporter [Calditrichaeota bacterium]|nr:MAG: MFS transporter [Calditrichota bacterium]